MLPQHYSPPFGAPTHPAGDVAAFFANPGKFMHDVVTSVLANWQPPIPEATRGALPDPDELFDVAAAAAFLVVVPQTIHDYVKREVLKPLRLRPGGKLYFTRGQLLAALNPAPNGYDKRRKANKKA